MNPPPLTQRFARAVQRARQIHDGDTRRGSEIPYLAHLLGVAALVLDDGGSEDEAIAALLHDTVEDHADRISFQDVEKEFGPAVTRIVEACTEPRRPEGTWRAGKQGYIDHIGNAPLEARRVIMADKLDNIRSLVAGLERWGELYWSRFRSPTKDDLLWYHRALKEALSDWPQSPMHAEFNRLVAPLA